MANTAGMVVVQGGRPWRVVRAETVAALAVVGGPFRSIHSEDRRDHVVLSRNEVMQEALGGRTWFGALANAADGVLAEVTAHIVFHDRNGRPMGAPLGARAARLAPGAVLHLQARLPPEATGLRIHALRWTRGNRTVGLGPSGPLAFGARRD